MATRNVTMVVDRELASHNEAGFACNPDVVDGNSYVNMYLHHDGYPQFRAVELANWIKHTKKRGGITDSARVASNLVKDFHYESQYLYPSHLDIVFVLRSEDIPKRYRSDYDYTDWEKHKQNTNTY